jgi:RimJ/RimL family protein N-acetyltransferase
MMKEIELTNDLLLLRPLKRSDSQASYEAVRESIDDISPWMPWCHEKYALDDSKNWIKHSIKAWSNDTEYDFAIIDKKDRTFLGGCGLNNIDKNNRIANLGYWVRSSRKGKGIASSIVGLLARFAFEKLELNRIEIIPAVGNKASQRVAIKSGATKEGILRKRIVVHDRAYDGIMFSLVSDDLRYL